MTQVVTIAILMVISAFFSACEMAFSSVNKIRLRNYAAQGDKRANKALKIAEDFDKALTAILIGNNVVNIASTSIATVVFIRYFGDDSVGAATAVMTVVVLVFGEIMPKSLAKENAESITLATASILSAAIFLMTPLVVVFSGLKKLISFTSKNKGELSPTVTEEELKFIIDEIEDQGVLESQEGDLVKSALEFDEILVHEILIPRVNITAVEVSQDMESICKVFLEERYSRLPVYDKSIDNIIGILNHKDFFDSYIKGKDGIRDIIQNAMYISENKRISEVLHDMQKSQSHMAVVIDQYGGTEGILTMEDLFEELVGEINDENDNEPPAIENISENVYCVSAEISISDMLEFLDMPEDLIITECNSVGGWVMELTGSIPEKDENIKWGVFDITVFEVDEQRIKKLIIKIVEQAKD